MVEQIKEKDKIDGWVKVYRQLLLNDLWLDKPFSRGQAWLDLLLTVNHKEKEFLFGNNLVNVERGATITSIKKLANRWGWSRQKVSDFLNLLESKMFMITQKRDTKKTYLTITNYNSFQDIPEQQKDNKKTSNKHQKDTNKNVKNDKNSITLLHKVIQGDCSENKDLLPLLEKWLEHKKAKKQSYKDEQSIKELIKKLVNLSGGDFEKAQAIVDNAIANNWAGLYALKEQKNTPKVDNAQKTDWEARARG